MSAESGSSGSASRLVSLDVFRGLVMCALAINGLALAATAKKLDYGPRAAVDSWSGQLWQWLGFHTSHPFWNSQFYFVGCSLWDLIQPAFMFMVGAAMPYSYAGRRSRGDSPAKLTVHAFIRAGVLVLLGVFLASYRSGLDNNRLFTNVLAQIGLGYFFVFLLLGLSTKRQIIIGSTVLIGYWIWLVMSHAPNPLPNESAEVIESLFVPSSVAQHFAIYTNAPARMDVKFYAWWLGDIDVKPHQAGYATLNFIPSAITILLGVLAGSLLRSPLFGSQKLRRLFWGGAFCMSAALIASVTVCPLIKKIWTPAWTLYSGAWMFWMLALLYWVIDVKGWKRWTFPFVVVGMNSLAIYLMSILMKRPITDCIKTYFGNDIFAGPYGPTIQAIAVFFVLWLICLYLYRQRIFFRI